jgi:hypothetical protein
MAPPLTIVSRDQFRLVSFLGSSFALGLWLIEKASNEYTSPGFVEDCAKHWRAVVHQLFMHCPEVATRP